MRIQNIRVGDEVTIRARVTRAAEPAMPDAEPTLRVGVGEGRLIVEAGDIVAHQPQIRVGDRVRTPPNGAPGVLRHVDGGHALVKLDGRPVPVVVACDGLARDDDGFGVGDLVEFVTASERRGRGRIRAIEGSSAAIDCGHFVTSVALWSLSRLVRAAETTGWLNADVLFEHAGGCGEGFVYDFAPRAAGNPHTLLINSEKGVMVLSPLFVRRLPLSPPEPPCDVEAADA